MSQKPDFLPLCPIFFISMASFRYHAHFLMPFVLKIIVSCLPFAYFSCKSKSYHCYFYLSGSRNLFSRALNSLWLSKEVTPVSLSHRSISDSKLLKVLLFQGTFYVMESSNITSSDDTLRMKFRHLCMAMR